MAWFRPATLVDVYPLLLHYQSSGIAVRLTVGNTSTGVIKVYNVEELESEVVMRLTNFPSNCIVYCLHAPSI